MRPFPKEPQGIRCSQCKSAQANGFLVYHPLTSVPKLVQKVKRITIGMIQYSASPKVPICQACFQTMQAIEIRAFFRRQEKHVEAFPTLPEKEQVHP